MSDAMCGFRWTAGETEHFCTLDSGHEAREHGHAHVDGRRTNELAIVAVVVDPNCIKCFEHIRGGCTRHGVYTAKESE